MNDLIKQIKQRNWITREDYDPDEDGTYLVTMEGDILGLDEPFTTMCGYYDGKWDENGVIAWTLLPRPYDRNAPKTFEEHLRRCEGCRYAWGGICGDFMHAQPDYSCHTEQRKRGTE